MSGERPDDANGEPERASQISRGVSLVSRDMAEGEPVERGRSRARPPVRSRVRVRAAFAGARRGLRGGLAAPGRARRLEGLALGVQKTPE